jgi:PHD/YefM family antitoxin component YafN of YafNO toxin-antitoxin module
MEATAVQSFATHVDELFATRANKRAPLVIERNNGNLVIMTQVDFDNLMSFAHKKKKKHEEYAQIRDAFFQSSRQSMANKIAKYLD